MFIKLEKGATGKIDDVGGKGYSLLTLVNLGYSVPCGFIVSSNHFIEMLKINGVYNNVVNICNDTTLGNFKENSIALQNLVMQCDMPFNNSELLSDLSTLVSIRSSAVSEDGKNHSFAGLHDSFLNVGTDNVLLNIKKVYMSLFNDRAIFYRLRKNIPLFEGMAVIVQNMVVAKYAGVVFTQHPVDKKYILVEYSEGLGDQIANGKITPVRHLLERDNIGSEGFIADLIKNCLEIEKIFGSPQDIEWVFGDKIYFLQSRAIVE